MEATKLTFEIFSKLEKRWLMEWGNSNTWSSPSSSEEVIKKKTRILTIDGGGGIKGLAAGAALVHLEGSLRSSSGDPNALIPEFFDVIVGTGFGGILAAMITAADPSSGRPLFSASAAVDFLLSRFRRLFRPTGVLPLLRSRRRTQFSSRSLESVLREAFVNPEGRALTLKDTCKPILIPCYDLNTAAPFVFSCAGATDSASFDFELWRACRATSATPGLFKPCRLASVDGKTLCVAIDGGLVLNNPAAVAVTHVLHNKRDFPTVAGVEDLVLLSLGSGSSARPVEKARRCSKMALLEIVLDGVSDTVDQFLASAFCWNPRDYIRIQANGFGTEEKDKLEGARKAGELMLKERAVESLPFGGKRLLTQSNEERIQGLVQRLVARASAKDMPSSPFKGNAVECLSDGR
ncbi:probable inactive patatin-like protein 9 [Typha latifolia]|uniref:probable inactive patatin-like protein 9 n=1 Tax=Typha latifolia TaxID=4733 RepID=UPI003C2BB973